MWLRFDRRLRVGADCGSSHWPRDDAGTPKLGSRGFLEGMSYLMFSNRKMSGEVGGGEGKLILSIFVCLLVLS